ncbi:MAG: hypothetical protein GPJ54_18820 [Candidatus Heimdallarchaeota archaeon]|nr:hypothetical protein [Candidatus Heimdallarchaeota archaeon]
MSNIDLNSIESKQNNPESKYKMFYIIFTIVYSMTFIKILYDFSTRADLNFSYNYTIGGHNILYNDYGMTTLEREIILLGFIIKYLLFIFLLFYFVKYIVSYSLHMEQNRDETTKSETSTVLKISDFFSKEFGRVPYYQIITSLTMIYYFIMHFYLIFRFENEGYKFSPIGSMFQFLAILTLFIILVEVIILTRYFEHIKSKKFIKFSNKLFLAVSVMAYYIFNLVDTELFVVLGICMVFPVLLLQIFNILGVSYRSNSSGDSSPLEIYLSVPVDEKSRENNYGLMTQIFFSLILQLFALFSFYFVVVDYNYYLEDSEKISFINVYSIMYFVILLIMGSIIYLSTSPTTYSKLEKYFKYSTILAFIIFASLFVYDDLFFSVEYFMTDNNILFFGTLLFLQIPATIVTALEIRLFKYSKSSKSTNIILPI